MSQYDLYGEDDTSYEFFDDYKAVSAAGKTTQSAVSPRRPPATDTVSPSAASAPQLGRSRQPPSPSAAPVSTPHAMGSGGGGGGTGAANAGQTFASSTMEDSLLDALAAVTAPSPRQRPATSPTAPAASGSAGKWEMRRLIEMNSDGSADRRSSDEQRLSGGGGGGRYDEISLLDGSGSDTSAGGHGFGSHAMMDGPDDDDDALYDSDSDRLGLRSAGGSSVFDPGSDADEQDDRRAAASASPMPPSLPVRVPRAPPPPEQPRLTSPRPAPDAGGPTPAGGSWRGGDKYALISNEDSAFRFQHTRRLIPLEYFRSYYIIDSFQSCSAPLGAAGPDGEPPSAVAAAAAAPASTRDGTAEFWEIYHVREKGTKRRLNAKVYYTEDPAPRSSSASVSVASAADSDADSDSAACLPMPEHVQRECVVSLLLSHVNLIKCYDVFFNQDADAAAIQQQVATLSSLLFSPDHKGGADAAAAAGGGAEASATENVNNICPKIVTRKQLGRRRSSVSVIGIPTLGGNLPLRRRGSGASLSNRSMSGSTTAGILENGSGSNSAASPPPPPLPTRHERYTAAATATAADGYGVIDDSATTGFSNREVVPPRRRIPTAATAGVGASRGAPSSGFAKPIGYHHGGANGGGGGGGASSSTPGALTSMESSFGNTRRARKQTAERTSEASPRQAVSTSVSGGAETASMSIGSLNTGQRRDSGDTAVSLPRIDRLAMVLAGQPGLAIAGIVVYEFTEQTTLESLAEVRRINRYCSEGPAAPDGSSVATRASGGSGDATNLNALLRSVLERQEAAAVAEQQRVRLTLKQYAEIHQGVPEAVALDCVGIVAEGLFYLHYYSFLVHYSHFLQVQESKTGRARGSTNVETFKNPKIMRVLRNMRRNQYAIPNFFCIVHNNVRLDNFLTNKEGTLKLLDFEYARLYVTHTRTNDVSSYTRYFTRMREQQQRHKRRANGSNDVDDDYSMFDNVTYSSMCSDGEWSVDLADNSETDTAGGGGGGSGRGAQTGRRGSSGATSSETARARDATQQLRKSFGLIGRRSGGGSRPAHSSMRCTPPAAPAGHSSPRPARGGPSASISGESTSGLGASASAGSRRRASLTAPLDDGAAFLRLYGAGGLDDADDALLELSGPSAAAAALSATETGGSHARLPPHASSHVLRAAAAAVRRAVNLRDPLVYVAPEVLQQARARLATAAAAPATGSGFTAATALGSATAPITVTAAADMWAVGVALCHLLLGRPPTPAELLRDVIGPAAGAGGTGLGMASGTAALGPIQVRRATRDLLGRLLAVDPQRRLTVADLLQHPALQLDQ